MPSTCWMTATRAPWSVPNVNFVPTPGRRVSLSSDGISRPFQCRRGEKPAAEALGLLHQDNSERRRGEDVQTGEGDEILPVAQRYGRVAGGNLRQDDRELA